MIEEQQQQEEEVTEEVMLPEEVISPEDLFEGDDSYPYGPKGPSRAEINTLKEKYGDLQLTEVAGNIYIYRLMLRGEHMKLVESGALEGDDSEMITVETLLVWPNPKEIDWDAVGAGVVPTLSTDMLQFSGFIRLTQPIKL